MQEYRPMNSSLYGNGLDSMSVDIIKIINDTEIVNNYVHQS